MDLVTLDLIMALAAKYPGYAVHLTHGFLDGTKGKACGFQPHDWNGGVVTLIGQWP